jgi:peptidoglycan/xylan/chitin deacetylase (PgdA/CDA1 family)
VLPVLMYHSVSTVASGPLRQLAVPPALLADQLVALREAGFTLLGLTEALRRHQADPVGERIVAVTFDDGYANFLTGGLAALATARARATLYLAVGHLGRGPASWLGRRGAELGPLLDWSGVAEVTASGVVEIGSHNMMHVPMDILPRPLMARAISDARHILQDRTQTPVASFAYPHGYHDRAVRAAVARAGHESACEVGHRRYRGVDHRYAIPRLLIGPDHRPDEVVALVSGAAPWLVPTIKRVAQPGWRLVRRVANLAGVRLT